MNQNFRGISLTKKKSSNEDRHQIVQCLKSILKAYLTKSFLVSLNDIKIHSCQSNTKYIFLPFLNVKMVK